MLKHAKFISTLEAIANAFTADFKQKGLRIARDLDATRREVDK